MIVGFPNGYASRDRAYITPISSVRIGVATAVTIVATQAMPFQLKFFPFETGGWFETC